MSERLSEVSSVSGVSLAGARTVVSVAEHMVWLIESATHLQTVFETRERGYFSPSEDEQVAHLWVSYHGSRSALLEIIQAVRNEVGKASREQIGEFALAYAATLVLVDAARSLRDQFGKNDLVRRKLNEAYDDFRNNVPLLYVDYSNLNGIYGKVLTIVKQQSKKQDDLLFVSLMRPFSYHCAYSQ